MLKAYPKSRGVVLQIAMDIPGLPSITGSVTLSPELASRLAWELTAAASVATLPSGLPENTLEIALHELIEAYGYDAVDTVVEELGDSYSHMPRGQR